MVVDVGSAGLELNGANTVSYAYRKPQDDRTDVIRRCREEDARVKRRDTHVWHDRPVLARWGLSTTMSRLDGSTLDTSLRPERSPVSKALLLEPTPAAILVNRTGHFCSLRANDVHNLRAGPARPLRSLQGS